jgi:hypothetical protein
MVSANLPDSTMLGLMLGPVGGVAPTSFDAPRGNDKG